MPDRHCERSEAIQQRGVYRAEGLIPRPWRFSWIASSLTLLAMTAFPALAAPKDDLSRTRWQMDESKEHQAELAGQAQKVQGELLELQKLLVEAARDVQQAEVEMIAAQEKL